MATRSPVRSTMNTVPSDWRMAGGSFRLRYSEARKNKLFTDVECVVGQGSSAKTFSAHRFILACASPLLEKILYGPHHVKSSSVLFPRDDPEDFEMLLGYIYDEPVPIQSVIRACNYHAIAARYFISDPQSVAVEFIESTTIDDATFWEIIKKNFFFHPLLQRKLMVYIERNVQDIINSKHILKLKQVELEYILQMDILNVDELSLLRAATKWGLYRFGKEASLKQLKPVLRYIRFSVLTVSELYLFEDEFKIFPSKDYYDILKYLFDKIDPLPTWCCTRVEPRLLPPDH